MYTQGPILINYDLEEEEDLSHLQQEAHPELSPVIHLGRQLDHLKTQDDPLADGLRYNQENLRVSNLTPISIVLYSQDEEGSEPLSPPSSLRLIYSQGWEYFKSLILKDPIYL